MSELLKPGHERADIATVGRAIREGWVIPARALEYIPKKLLEQIAKGEDDISIKASALFLKIVEQNTDRERPQVAPSVKVQVNNGVSVTSNADTGGGRASAILERLRVARISGPTPG